MSAILPVLYVDAVAHAAFVFVEAREESKRLRRAYKDEFLAAHPDIVESDGERRFGDTLCPKRNSGDYGPEGPTMLPREEWCHACQKASALRHEYLAAVRRRGVALRRLTATVNGGKRERKWR